jgi:Flp pilus assembly protein CpaB
VRAPRSEWAGRARGRAALRRLEVPQSLKGAYDVTPGTGTQRSAGGGFLAGLLIGLGVTALFLCLGGAVGYSYVKKKAADARRGWNLVPVVVAAVDIAEDTTVTMEMISQRSIPEPLVTSSVVKPNSASYIVQQRILVPVQAGDPLLWSQSIRRRSR